MLTHTLYTIVEMLNYFLIFYIFFGRLPVKGVPKYIVFLCSIFAFNLLPLNVELDTYVFFALGFLMSIFLVNGSKQENMINFISVFTLNHIFSLLFLYFFAIVKDISFENAAGVLTYCIFTNLAVTLSLSISILCIKLTDIHADPFIIFHSKIYYILLAGSLFIVSGIIGTLQALAQFSNINYYILNMASLFFIILIIIFFLMWIALSNIYRKQLFHKHQEELARLRMSDQEKQFTIIHDSDAALRRFRHDSANHITILNSLLNSQKYSEAALYLKSLGIAFEETNCVTYTNIAAVNAVVSHYHQKIKNKKFEFNWINSCISIPSNIDAFDICTVLDNILSNALEACEKIPADTEIQPAINIDLSVRNSHLVIHQSNTTASPAVIDANGLPLTTKNDKAAHGFGISNIKHTIDKYNGVFKFRQSNSLSYIDIIM